MTVNLTGLPKCKPIFGSFFPEIHYFLLHEYNHDQKRGNTSFRLALIPFQKTWLAKRLRALLQRVQKDRPSQQREKIGSFSCDMPMNQNSCSRSTWSKKGTQSITVGAVNFRRAASERVSAKDDGNNKGLKGQEDRGRARGGKEGARGAMAWKREADPLASPFPWPPESSEHAIVIIVTAIAIIQLIVIPASSRLVACDDSPW